MKAVAIKRISLVEERLLELVGLATPILNAKQILAGVSACRVHHTKLDEIEEGGGS